MLFVALACSMLGLAAGPLLVAVGRSRARASAALEGLALGLVPTLLAVRLLPHVVSETGAVGAGLCLAGYALMVLADRSHRSASASSALVVPALALHAFTDGTGVALAAASEGASSYRTELAVALVAHKLPEGLFLATALVPHLGWPRTLGRIGVVALATLLGALGGSGILRFVPESVLDGAVALGLGAMLRLSVHSHAPPPSTPEARAASGALFLLGVGAALSLPAPDSVLRHALGSELPVQRSFLPMLVETAPALLVALGLATVAHSLLGRRAPSFDAEGLARQSARGTLLGLTEPAAPALVLARGEELFTNRAPPAAMTAYVLAAAGPDLGALALGARLLGWRFGVLVFVGASAVAFLGGLASASAVVRSRFRRVLRRRLAPVPQRPPLPPGPSSPGDALARAAAAWGPWYLGGLVAACAVEAALDPLLVSGVGAPPAVLAASCVGLVALLDARAALLVVAVLVHKGLPIPAAVALLCSGGGTGVRVALMLTARYGKRVGLGLAGAILGASSLLGVAAWRLVPAGSVPEVHELLAHRHWAIEWVAVGGVVVLLVASLLRLGPRAWLAGGATRDPHGHADYHG